MPGPLPIDDVISKTLRGIGRAHRDYAAWTGKWLWEAPEYMTTVYIAREIRMTKGHEFYLTLESHAGQTIGDAGGIGRGRVSDESRLGGKFDVVLYWGHGAPRAVIEVKKQVSRFTQLEQDTRRICDALRNPSNTIRCALLAFYTSWKKNTRDNSARDRIREILNNVDLDAQKYLKNERTFVKSSMRRGRISGDKENAWVAALLRMERE